MPQRGWITQWPLRRLCQAGITVCVLHCGVVLADDFSSLPEARPVVLAAAPLSTEPLIPPYRRGIEVQQPPADGPSFLLRNQPQPAAVLADTASEPETGVAAGAQAAAQTEIPAGEAPAAPGGTGLLGLHSAIEFGVFAANRQPLEADNAAFHEQVRRISANLQAAARNLYPEQMKRIGAFTVYVGDSENLSTMSSGTGKVAINAGFSKLKPADDWMAFAIAREMGHVLAGHHDNNSGASLAVSLLMNVVVPGSGLIKSVISFAGSQIASSTGHGRQVGEADEVALKLLEAAGYPRKSVALNLRLAPLAGEYTTSWAKDFRASAARLTGVPMQAPDTATADSGLAGTMQNSGVQPVAVPVAAAPVAAQNWRPEELVRTRPSGLPGPIYVGGYAVPARRVE